MSSENSPAREEIFASIRKNLAASAPFDAVRKEHHHDLITQSASVSVESSQTATERFRENLEAVGGKCTIVNNKDEAVAAIQTIIESANPTRIAVSDSPIASALRDSIRSDAQMFANASAQELFDCELGITSAQYAIAETGTLVLESEKEFSRLTSLVPPVHVCVLEAGNIRATMAEILQTVKNELSPTVTFITGPSRTSDIELTLAIGVHGPRELYVIVVDSL
jgi:L-lactate dehydrogenase complex protein LldG